MGDILLDQMLADIGRNLSQSVLERMASSLSRPVADIRVRIMKVFGRHLKHTLDRCKYVKTILSEDNPVDIDDIYVSLFLTNEGRDIPDSGLQTLLINKRRIIIRGTAGSGKTMILKKLAFELHNKGGLLPIFISLRDLEAPDRESFLKGLVRISTPESSPESTELFYAGLRCGLFTFLMDGLDEIPPDFRNTRFVQMHRFPFDFPEVKIIISSRPETNLSAFDSFSIFQVKLLDKDQACEIINRSKFRDIEKRDKFVSDLRDDLFTSRHSFSSIPLLLLLMMMSYSANSEVPDRQSEFYDQAFDTLFYRHDSSKGPFRRLFHSGVDRREFRRIFSSFCFRSLYDSSISFSEREIDNYIEKALKFTGNHSNPEMLKLDLLESVCLMFRDGGKIDFIHRSFQEFFTAEFLAQHRSANNFEIFDSVFRKSSGDKVAPMLLDIDKPLIEEVWVIPTVERSCRKLSSYIDKRRKMIHVHRCIRQIVISDKTGDVVNVVWNSDFDLSSIYSVLQSVYPKLSSISGMINLTGLSGVPSGFESVRDAVARMDGSPDWMKEDIDLERQNIDKARKEKTYIEQHKISTWELDLADEEIRFWLAKTDIPKIIPEMHSVMAELLKDLKHDRSERKRLDIINDL